jgi:hypothetical protein
VPGNRAALIGVRLLRQYHSRNEKRGCFEAIHLGRMRTLLPAGQPSRPFALVVVVINLTIPAFRQNRCGLCQTYGEDRQETRHQDAPMRYRHEYFSSRHWRMRAILDFDP